MVSSGETKTVSKKLERIPKALEICEQVARALVETGQAWLSSGWGRRLGGSTDYERARNKVLKDLRLTETELRTLRASEFSPEAIHGTAYLLKIREACMQCPQTNRRRLQEGEGFVCLARAQVVGKGATVKPDQDGGLVASGFQMGVQ